jgi:hypothetical protein
MKFTCSQVAATERLLHEMKHPLSDSGQLEKRVENLPARIWLPLCTLTLSYVCVCSTCTRVVRTRLC